MKEFRAVDSLVQAQEYLKVGQIDRPAGFMTGHGSAKVVLTLESLYQLS